MEEDSVSSKEVKKNIDSILTELRKPENRNLKRTVDEIFYLMKMSGSMQILQQVKLQNEKNLNYLHQGLVIAFIIATIATGGPIGATCLLSTAAVSASIKGVRKSIHKRYADLDGYGEIYINAHLQAVMRKLEKKNFDLGGLFDKSLAIIQGVDS